MCRHEPAGATERLRFSTSFLSYIWAWQCFVSLYTLLPGKHYLLSNDTFEKRHPKVHESFAVKLKSGTVDPEFGNPNLQGGFAKGRETAQRWLSRSLLPNRHNLCLSCSYRPATMRLFIPLFVAQCIYCLQVSRFMDDYLHGRSFIDPEHVSDGGVTPEHVRRWKLLQELQVLCRLSRRSASS